MGYWQRQGDRASDPGYVLPGPKPKTNVGFRTDGPGPREAPPVDKFVARLNIEHYRKRLASEGDEAQRQMLQRLLAEEEAKLAAIEGKPEKKGA